MKLPPYGLKVQDAVDRLAVELGEPPLTIEPPVDKQTKYTVRWSNGVYAYITRDGDIEAPLIAQNSLRTDMMVGALKAWHSLRGDPFVSLGNEEGWESPPVGERLARTTDGKILVRPKNIAVYLDDADDDRTCEVAREIKALFQ